MTRLYSTSLSLVLATALSIPSNAQDLKPLDHAPVYRKQGISKRICREVKLNKTPHDTTMVGMAYFNHEGFMTEYHEYFAGGRLYAIYEYGYDEKGKLSSALVKHAFNQMEPIEFDIEYNNTGKVISLTLRESIRNFWRKQSFTYTDKGVMIRSEQWFDRDGTLTSLNRKEYPGYLGPSDNSLNHLFDQRGLQIVHQFYGTNGIVERMWLFSYE